MINDSTIVSFGELRLSSPVVVRLTSRNAINDIATASISLDVGSPLLHTLSLNEPVSISVNDHCIFTGMVTEAKVNNGLLVVSCSSAPQMESQHTAGYAKAHPFQVIRLIALDTGLTTLEADDDNEICPAANCCLDWDAFLSDLMAAPDFLAFTSVLQSNLTGINPSSSEQRLLSQVIRLVQKEIARHGLEDVSAGEVLRCHYEAAFPSILASSWRHRRMPDAHEVTVPLQQITASPTSIIVGDVNFIDGDSSTPEFFKEDTPKELISGWSAQAYARTTVYACDLWSAKTTGLKKIHDAMTVLAFAHTYTSWQQKVDEAVYEPVQYSRPAGASGTLGSLVRVVNTRSGDYWVGLIKNKSDPCNLEQLQSSRGALLSQTSIGEDNELHRHVQRALSWRYRAQHTSLPVDAFLYTWVSLEMLFQRPSEKTPDLIRRLPFAILSMGDKSGAIRTELQRKWIPLRDEIVHRAIVDHPDIATANRRVHYFSDCAIAYALARARHSPSYDDWLDHLDSLSLSRKKH